MSKGNQIMTELLFNINANTASLKQGLDEAKGQVKIFSEGLNKVKSLIAGAFAVGAIVGAAKSLFEFATGIDDVIGKIDDLGISFNNLDAGRLKAITDTFEVDMDKVLGAANAASKQFGISFSDSLKMVQEGLALAGPQSEKYLKSLESGAAGYASLNGSASDYFAVVTNGYRTSAEFEKDVKAGINSTGKAFSDLAGEMNEGQLIQQRLINSQSEFYALAAKTFDGTGDLVDNLKANLFELGVKTFKVVKQALVDTINYFIEMYNESMLFRGVIQYIVLAFKQVWEAVKLVGNLIFDVFKGAGKLIKAVFTGDFASIPDIVKDHFKNLAGDFIIFGENSAENLVTGLRNTLSKEKIELISDEDVTDAVAKVQKGIAGAKSSAVAAVEKVNFIPNAPKSESYKPISMGDISPEGSVKVDLEPQIEQLNTYKSIWGELGETISSTIGGTAVDAFSLLGETLVGANDDAKKSFGDLVKSMLQGIGKTIQGLLAQAIAATLATEAKKGILGLITGAVAVGGIMALFKSKIPKFEHGGISQGGLSMVGEKGAELVHLPTNSRVYNSEQTKSLLGAGGGMNINITSMVRGEDIYFAYNEVARKRGLTI